MNIDLNAGKSVAAREDEGTVVHVRDEIGEKLYQDEAKTLPATITVVGTYSSRYRRLSEANRDKMLKQRRSQMDGDQLNQQSLELVASCILSWDGFVTVDGPFPYTKANAVALLDACPWIREQVEAAMNDHASFLR